MNRRAVVMAGLATLPASLVGTRAIAAPKKGAGRKKAAARRRTPARKAGGQQAGGQQAPRRQRAAKFKTVTRTFSSTVPMTIPAGAPGVTSGQASVYPSTIQVSGLSQGRIQKLTVRLVGLSHTFPGDLDIMVVAPGNKGVILMSDAGTTAVVGVSLTFDQDAPHRVPGTAIISGTYQPANDTIVLDPFPAPAPAGVTGHSLTALNNRNPNGIWSLFVVDDAGVDTGSLAGWALTIRARVKVQQRRRSRRGNATQRRQPARRGKR